MNPAHEGQGLSQFVASVLARLPAPTHRLGDVQIARMEQPRCLPISNGRDRLDPRSGLWDYAGNPVAQGRLDDPCRKQQFRRLSLSERGLLFSSTDYVRR